MAEENIIQEFRLQKRSKEIELLMRKKYKNVCTTLNYIEHFLILTSTITGCILISDFAFVIGIPRGIGCAIGLEICVITAGIEKVYVNNLEREKES